MPKKLYHIDLNDEEYQSLLEMTRKGKIRARQMKRAMILLKAHEGLSDPQIMAALNVSRPCVERIRKRFVIGGMEKALNEDPRPGQRRKLDGRAEATLIATACSQVPEGHEHWTLRLLLWMRCHMKPCAGRLKKRNKAVAEGNVVYSRGQCGICGLYGRRSRSIRASL